MNTLATLLVVGPLLAGALIAGASVIGIGSRLADPVALAVALAVTAGAVRLAIAAGDGTRVVWQGGWVPEDGQPLGVALVADRPALLMVCLVGLLTVAALTYSWQFLAGTGASYVVLVLVFLGACSGFVLAGDVFDAFVWFELMGVAAYALTGMRIEEQRSVHGALSFGIVNTVGASLSLSGVALLYARTGQLNLAAIGETLRAGPHDHLVMVSCALLLTGVLVKMALVPFHFWTADAEAVAPTPVCVLLSGAMITVGAFAVARWWWIVFDGAVPSAAIRHALIGFGAVTAVVGAVMCASQRHLKRLLAYSTIAHSGVIACGIGLLSGPGLAAAGLYAAGHACAKGALFLVTGILLNRFETLDEHELHGRGRDMRVAGRTFPGRRAGARRAAAVRHVGREGGVRDGLRRRARGVAGAGRGSRVGADRWRGPARGDADLPGSRRGSRPRAGHARGAGGRPPAAPGRLARPGAADRPARGGDDPRRVPGCARRAPRAPVRR